MPIEDVRDGSWHHIVATKDDAAAKLYIDGVEVHSGTGAGSTPAKAPWHVMRNGFNPAFSEGEADEVALYTRPLSAEKVRDHYELALSLAGEPLPPESPDPAAEPPAAGSGLGGGVLGGTSSPLVRAPVGSAWIRRGVLVVRGAAGAANRIVARRRRARWLVSDGAAPLRPGPGCRRVGASTVSCRAAKVKRIVLHGGAGNDRLAVAARVRALLVGGRGNDRLIGGPAARFRGGPGADLTTRRR
jgi:hypothetical protein